MEPSFGNFYIISGPSGAGKNTIITKLMKQNKALRYSVSITTRPMRKGETNGVHYFFVNEEEFEEKIQSDQLLEWAKVAGYYYGTPRSFAMEQLMSGNDIITDIDIQGARKIKSKLPQAILIFILPPSFSVLQERLRSRATDSEEIITKRLLIAKEEVKAINEYDYVVINDDLTRAAAKINNIICASKLKVSNWDTERLIAEFFSH